MNGISTVLKRSSKEARWLYCHSSWHALYYYSYAQWSDAPVSVCHVVQPGELKVDPVNFVDLLLPQLSHVSPVFPGKQREKYGMAQYYGHLALVVGACRFPLFWTVE